MKAIFTCAVTERIAHSVERLTICHKCSCYDGDYGSPSQLPSFEGSNLLCQVLDQLFVTSIASIDTLKGQLQGLYHVK